MAKVAKAGGLTVNADTITDFVNGVRWPRTSTIGKIEQLFEWPPGRIEDLADGVELAVDSDGNDDRYIDPQVKEEALERFAAVIRDDPVLLDKSKAHILNQYGLLPQRLSAPRSTTVTSIEDRRRDEAASEPVEDESRGSRAARRGPEPKDGSGATDDS